MEILRATTLAQMAGAFYVRIEAMARKYGIPLEKEFDEHDGTPSKYIVVIDDYLVYSEKREGDNTLMIFRKRI